MSASASTGARTDLGALAEEPAPLVSIVIPVYNGATYLEEAINSALRQTYKNIEVIVINDGSTDSGETESVALSFGDRIRYFSKPNGGVASALNRGVQEMRGQYFSWLSHDDLYLPEKVQTQVEMLKGFPQDTICYSDFIARFEDTGRETEIRLDPGPSGQFRYFITAKNALHGCTLLIPRAAFDQHGLFREDLKTTQDYECWFRMARTFNFVHLAKPLVVGRQHTGQGSVRMRTLARKECNALFSRFVKDLLPDELSRGDADNTGEAYLVLARSFRTRGFFQAALTARNLASDSGRVGALALLWHGLLCIPDLTIAPFKSRVQNLIYNARKLLRLQ